MSSLLAVVGAEQVNRILIFPARLEQVTATDGLLGDHLRLQIIATTNAPVRELDGTLTRPGRLVGIREFGRLAPAQARRLAEAKGLKLPDQPDYSLGEIYCGAVGGPVPNEDRQIGFAQ